ncbi:MAG: outer membrane protein transport protein [Rhodospirillaceae bacterium]|nr:outer membrane protein transport protein [Rhodospirillaceae bacterium]
MAHITQARRFRHVLAAGTAVWACFSAGTALAGTGYAVGHESVTGAGVAYAGGAAAALDAGTIHTNPAGMSVLAHDELMVGTQVLLPTIHFVNQGSTIFNGAPLTGTSDGKGGKLAVVPNFYWVKTINDQVKFGLGVTAPYGLVTDYTDTWIGRYNEILTSLKVGNVNPSVSVKLSDTVALGVGVNAQYALGKLRQAIDFGTVCASALGLPTCAGGFGLAPQANDGSGTVKGEDFGMGWNAGLLFTPSDSLRLGVHYRSHVKLQFDGSAKFTVPANARTFLTVAGLGTAFTPTTADFSLTIPEQASGSIYAKVDPKLALMADVTWTRWSRFDELRILFGNATPTNVLTTQWENVFRVSGGAVYDYSDTWTLRGGIAYDESPILDAFRGPGIPDADRFVTAVGFSYKVNDTLTLDGSYQHLFFKDGPSRRPSATGSSLNGTFKVDVPVIGFGLRWAM